MPVSRLLYCIGRGLAEVGLGDIAVALADPTGIGIANLLGKVAGKAVGEWRSGRKEDQLHRDILEVVEMSFPEAKRAAAEIASTVAPDDEVLRGHVERFVTQVPTAVRKSLVRPSDPTGTTLPADFRVRDKEDMLRILPNGLTRFRAGDRPPFLNGWELVEQVGSGGMGEVWKAQKFGAASLVAAIKFPHVRGPARQALKNELDIIDRVQAHGIHPNIVELQDIWSDDHPIPWLRYEYLAGGDLSGKIRAWQAFPAAERVARATAGLIEIVAAVAYLHRLDPVSVVVHRDLKPSNILVGADGRLKLADLGIGAASARRSLTLEKDPAASRGYRLQTQLHGSCTPLYASPQQRQNPEAFDPRDDIHALGIIAYQMLTGLLDRGSGASFESDLRHAGTPRPLVALLLRCVAHDPGERPDDGQVFLDELCAPAVSGPTGARTGAAPLPRTPFLRDHSAAPGGTDSLTVALPRSWNPLRRVRSITVACAAVGPGTFVLGSPADESNRADNEPVARTVVLTRRVSLGRTPVTVGQYRAFASATRRPMPRPPQFAQSAWGDDHPVVGVVRADAVAFCRWLTERTGRNVRLPTECEWEAACRAGAATPFASGRVLGAHLANFDASRPYGPAAPQGSVSVGTAPVGAWSNALGFADMHGQVWEFCRDDYSPEPDRVGGSTDPLVLLGTADAVVRGGSWRQPAWRCRSASRERRTDEQAGDDVGFRVAVSED